MAVWSAIMERLVLHVAPHIIEESNMEKPYHNRVKMSSGITFLFDLFLLYFCVHESNKFTGKTFQAAQLTHERFLTIDHSWKIFF